MVGPGVYGENVFRPKWCCGCCLVPLPWLAPLIDPFTRDPLSIIAVVLAVVMMHWRDSSSLNLFSWNYMVQIFPIYSGLRLADLY